MNTNLSEDFRALTILSNAFMIGLALITIIIGLFNSAENNFPFISPMMDILLVSTFALMSIFFSGILSKKQLSKISEIDPQDKISAFGTYRSAVILRLALLEGPGLIATIISLVTGNLNLLFIPCIIMIAMYMKRPSEDEYVALLR